MHRLRKNTMTASICARVKASPNAGAVCKKTPEPALRWRLSHANLVYSGADWPQSLKLGKLLGRSNPTTALGNPAPVGPWLGGRTYVLVDLSAQF